MAPEVAEVALGLFALTYYEVLALNSCREGCGGRREGHTLRPRVLITGFACETPHHSCTLQHMWHRRGTKAPIEALFQRENESLKKREV